MNKQTRAVFFFLVAIIAILAASTSFFAAKTFKMNGEQNKSPDAKISESIISTGSENQAPTPAQSSGVTRAAASTEKPSLPADTYTVQKGETLFTVAQVQGSNWQDITEANGLTNADKIQAGKALIIPKGGQISFTVDNTRSTVIQKDADQGKYQFRLSPVETARSDAPPCYGITITDNFTLKNKDDSGAQVQVSHEGKNYIIKLIQPITKGDKGIWAIESIKPV